MSDSNVQALALLIGPVAATFASLPLPLVQRIFLALPPDSRGRACCVCRAWRDVLADPALWTRLDMSFIDHKHHYFTVLHDADAPPAACFSPPGRRQRGAARGRPPNQAAHVTGKAKSLGRARNQLSQLDVSRYRYGLQELLLPLLTANAGSLRELHLQSVVAN